MPRTRDAHIPEYFIISRSFKNVDGRWLTDAVRIETHRTDDRDEAVAFATERMAENMSTWIYHHQTLAGRTGVGGMQIVWAGEPEPTHDDDDARDVQREQAARLRVAHAANVPELCSALNAFEEIRKESGCFDVEGWPVFDEDYELDWRDFADEPISVDAQYVLFKEQATGRYYYMAKSYLEQEPG